MIGSEGGMDWGGEGSMSARALLAMVGGALLGSVLVCVVSPPAAVAQSTPGGVPPIGLYQIQIASGLPAPGTSTIWRLNTVTGALDFCTFNNVTVSGTSHVVCQGGSVSQK